MPRRKASYISKQEKISFPERQSKTEKHQKGPEKWKITGWLYRMYVKHCRATGSVVGTHTNHSLGLEEKYLPLPHSVCKEVQEKFAQGVTLERIMNGMCISYKLECTAK